VQIVAVADTHLYHDELKVPDGDVFVHAGDLCRGGSALELAQAAKWIRGLPHATKIVVAGNHDFAFERDPVAARELLGDGIVYLQDSEITVGGVRFWGSPWQPAFNDWAFNLPRGAALAEKWAKIPERVDVLITHGPPLGFGDRTTVHDRQGCADLRERIFAAKPRLHLFGHIHEDGGSWSERGIAMANVTTWECERPPTVIDINDLRVRMVSVPATRRR
jgi:Icc-related predicted phosphoesterase